MSITWEFAYLLPHAAFQEPIENEYLALVPPDDSRLKALARQHTAVKRLAERFTDQFRRKLKPSALLVRSDAPKSVLDFYAVVSYRNLIAVASLIDAWTYQLGGGSAGYPLWTDYFDLYAFTPTKDYRQLMAQSVASMEIDQPTKFAGQRAAHLPTAERLSFGVDKCVLNTCLHHWKRRFVAGRREWKNRVLFRSLEIACQAARMPAVGTRHPTIHDAGIGISLWVSAFEILKQRRTDYASLKSVLTLLKRADWLDAKLKARRYSLKDRKGKVVARINYACKLYAELYRARCDFLHGNPVSAGNLFPSGERKSPGLLHCAPLVYRVALLAFLGAGSAPRPTGSLQRYAEACFAHSLHQGQFEDALLTCQRGGGAR